MPLVPRVKQGRLHVEYFPGLLAHNIIEMLFAVPGRFGVTIVLQNESWLLYCATLDFPVMLRKQKKKKILGSCLCCMRSKNKNCSYELRLWIF